MEFIVLDASVVLKWYLKEKGSSAAEIWRKKHLSGEVKICAPTLLYFEIVNALGTKRITAKVARAHIEALLALDISFYDSSVLDIKYWVSLIKELGISGYDASYITLAKGLSCSFVTADQKLFEKIKSLKFVKLLK